MKLEEAQTWVAKLKAAYPSSKALDEVTGDLFTETVMGMDSRDFAVAFKDMTATLKFFPSLAEMHEAVNFCRSRRIAFEDSQERRNRLALDSVMDPDADIHATVQGPNHARFLRLLRGQEAFPAPAWTKAKRERTA